MGWFGALVLAPALFAAATAVTPSPRLRRGLVTSASLLHFGWTCGLIEDPPGIGVGDWIGFDSLGLWALIIVSLTFGPAAWDAMSSARSNRAIDHIRWTGPLTIAVLWFATLTCGLHHLGLLWLAGFALSIAAHGLAWIAVRNDDDDDRLMRDAVWAGVSEHALGHAIVLAGLAMLAAACPFELRVGVGLTLTQLTYSSEPMKASLLELSFALMLGGYLAVLAGTPSRSGSSSFDERLPAGWVVLLRVVGATGPMMGILRADQMAISLGARNVAVELLSAAGLGLAVAAAVRSLRSASARANLRSLMWLPLVWLAMPGDFGSQAALAGLLFWMHHAVLISGWRLSLGDRLRDVATNRPSQIPLALAWGLCGLPPFGLFFAILWAGSVSADRLRTGPPLEGTSLLIIAGCAASLFTVWKVAISTSGEVALSHAARTTGDRRRAPADSLDAPSIAAESANHSVERRQRLGSSVGGWILAVAAAVMGVCMPRSVESVWRRAARALHVPRPRTTHIEVDSPRRVALRPPIPVTVVRGDD